MPTRPVWAISCQFQWQAHEFRGRVLIISGKVAGESLACPPEFQSRFGTPDGGLDSLHLTKERLGVVEVTIPRVLKWLGSFRRAIPVI